MDRDAVWDVDSWGPKNHVLDGGSDSTERKGKCTARVCAGARYRNWYVCRVPRPKSIALLCGAATRPLTNYLDTCWISRRPSLYLSGVTTLCGKSTITTEGTWIIWRKQSTVLTRTNSKLKTQMKDLFNLLFIPDITLYNIEFKFWLVFTWNSIFLAHFHSDWFLI